MSFNYKIIFQNTLSKFLSSDSLKSKAMLGSFWIGAGNALEQIFRLSRNVILARILAPEAFGFIAIIIAINQAFESFTQIGIKEAVIQHPNGSEKRYLNSAWFISTIRASILYLFGFFLAPFIASFYNDPELILPMRIAFLNLLFIGIMSPAAFATLKQMKFSRWTFLFNGGGICGILIAILLAFFMKNVWALIIGFSVEAIARCILSYVLCPFVPELNFDKESLNSLLKFAKGMFGLPILTFIFLKTDIFAVGKFCTMRELGMYSMAAAIAWAPFQFITMVTGQVMMPVFSEKQTDKEWSNKWILKITSFITLIGFPLFFFVALYSREILTIAYGAKFSAVATPFTVVFLVALARTCSTPIATIYLASGRPELHRLFTSIRAVAIVILIYPSIKLFGLTGAAIAAFFALMIGYIFQVIRLYKITNLKFSSYFNAFLPGIFFSSGVVVFWFAAKLLNFANPVTEVIPGIIGCCFSYIMAAYFLWGSKLNLNFLSK